MTKLHSLLAYCICFSLNFFDFSNRTIFLLFFILFLKSFFFFDYFLLIFLKFPKLILDIFLLLKKLILRLIIISKEKHFIID